MILEMAHEAMTLARYLYGEPTAFTIGSDLEQPFCRELENYLARHDPFRTTIARIPAEGMQLYGLPVTVDRDHPKTVQLRYEVGELGTRTVRIEIDQ